MAANDKSTRPVTWRLLFPFVFLEYLNTYTCFLYILVYKLLFFIVLTLCLHLLEGFPIFLMLVTVQQWCVGIGTFSCRYILRYPQSCNFFHERQNFISRICFWLSVDFFCNYMFLVYFVSYEDIDANPGPKNCFTSFSFGHWNLNCLTVDNYIKLFFLTSVQQCLQTWCNMPFTNLP